MPAGHGDGGQPPQPCRLGAAVQLCPIPAPPQSALPQRWPCSSRVLRRRSSPACPPESCRPGAAAQLRQAVFDPAARPTAVATLLPDLAAAPPPALPLLHALWQAQAPVVVAAAAAGAQVPCAPGGLAIGGLPLLAPAPATELASSEREAAGAVPPRAVAAEVRWKGPCALALGSLRRATVRRNSTRGR